MKPNKPKMSYVTLAEGCDFRRIAQIMSSKKHTMNHATARNVLMLSLNHLVRYISTEMGTEMSDDQIKEILRDQRVHEALSDVLFEAHRQITEEKSPEHHAS